MKYHMMKHDYLVKFLSWEKWMEKQRKKIIYASMKKEMGARITRI